MLASGAMARRWRRAPTLPDHEEGPLHGIRFPRGREGPLDDFAACEVHHEWKRDLLEDLVQRGDALAPAPQGLHRRKVQVSHISLETP